MESYSKIKTALNRILKSLPFIRSLVIGCFFFITSFSRPLASFILVTSYGLFDWLTT